MIVVKVELWPLGREERARELARMYLANDGTGDGSKGNYEVAVMRRGERRAPWAHGDGGNEVARPIRTGRVDGYARNAYNVLVLVARAIAAAFPQAKRAADHVELREGEDRRAIGTMVNAIVDAQKLDFDSVLQDCVPKAAKGLHSSIVSALNQAAIGGFEVGRHGVVSRQGEQDDARRLAGADDEDDGS